MPKKKTPQRIIESLPLFTPGYILFKETMVYMAELLSSDPYISSLTVN